MAIISSKTLCLGDVCRELVAKLPKLALGHRESASWQFELATFDERQFLGAVRGTERVAFQSRDQELEFYGLGAADIFRSDAAARLDVLAQLDDKANSLDEGQVYFGASRFDENAEIAPEWRSFGKKLFILPMLLVAKKNGRCTLSLNYRSDGHLSFSVWLDNAMSLLLAVATSRPQPALKIDFTVGRYLPHQEEYFSNIHRALKTMTAWPHHRKVVMGRRNSITIKNPLDPIELFFRLKQKSGDAFLFFLDCGFRSAFLGASPELLYRRHGRHLETESLAGTRPRASYAEEDMRLKEELFKSFKDNREHALVSMHIEEKLKEFDTTDLFSSKRKVMALAYVQHLLKRYHGTISAAVNDANIIKALHPTPAVCGLDIDWAREFIRANEGFDRGFYAGPIGFVGKDEAEFAVAIRSALFHEQNLYIYAACGIVPGSIPGQEWEELNNKEKNILSIFEEDH